MWKRLRDRGGDTVALASIGAVEQQASCSAAGDARRQRGVARGAAAGFPDGEHVDPRCLCREHVAHRRVLPVNLAVLKHDR